MTSSPTDTSRRRHVVIGDVGGHAQALFDELVRLGADPGTGRLPPDLHVIQVGDLIHRGPDSDQVISLVDGYLTHQPDQWTQLVGNHEMQYLREPMFEWPERLSTHSIETLRRWWADGQLRVAATVPTDGTSHLVTHAGVTVDFWQQVLGSTTSVTEAAEALDSLGRNGSDDLVRAGDMLLGADPPAGPVGPLWASAATELLPGWLSHELPFSQVHGHSSLYDWAHGSFRADAGLRRLTTVDEVAKHETTALPGGRIVGVDPCHGRVPRASWHGWEA